VCVCERKTKCGREKTTFYRVAGLQQATAGQHVVLQAACLACEERRERTPPHYIRSPVMRERLEREIY
jgi:hypothetical protein